MMEGIGWFVFGIIGICIGIYIITRPLFIARKMCYVCGRRIGIKGLKRKVKAEGLWYHYVCWVDFVKHEFIGENTDVQQ